MALIYVSAGIFFLVKGWHTMSPLQNTGIGILFISYGVFRGYRAHIISTRDNEETEQVIEN
jgi:hypothetical protein